MNIPLLIVASILFLVGFWGLIIPVIPDLPIMWFGILIYALGTRFVEISLTTTLLLGLLSASTYLVDYLATAIGAKRYGATRQGVVGGIVGGIVGLLIFPPFGFIVGAIIGTLFAELYLSGRSREAAARASQGVLIGLLLGIVTKFIIGGVMVGIFLQAIL